MARVTTSFLNQYPQMDIDQLQKPIVFVVDMINGFVKEGALHDQKIMDIVPAIQSLLEKEVGRNVFVADAHPVQTREFQSYPQHCVIGSFESEVVEELQPYVHELFHKNSTNTFFSPNFQEFVKERLDWYQDIIITGCCSDICILQFALSLQAYFNEHNMVNHRVIVPLSCIDTYHIDTIHDSVEWNMFSIRNMAANGIVVVSDFNGGM